MTNSETNSIITSDSSISKERSNVTLKFSSSKTNKNSNFPNIESLKRTYSQREISIGSNTYSHIIPYETLFSEMRRTRLANIEMKYNLSEIDMAKRTIAVKYLFRIGNDLKIKKSTIHKAIFYFDRILINNVIDQKEIEHLVTVCLILATKLNENYDSQTNTILIFKKRMDNIKNISNYEIQLMNCLKWDLRCTTASEFLELFKSQGIVSSFDGLSSTSSLNMEDIAENLNQTIEIINDLCIKKLDFIMADPLKLAVGIIYAARKLLGLEDEWNSVLENLTSIRWNEAKELGALILAYYRNFNLKGDDNKIPDENIDYITVPNMTDCATMSLLKEKYVS